MLSTALYFLSHGNVPEVLEDRGEERRWDSRLPLLPESLPQLGLQGGKALLGCRSLERGTGAGSRVPGARKAGPLGLGACARACALLFPGDGKVLNHPHALSRRGGRYRAGRAGFRGCFIA